LRTSRAFVVIGAAVFAFLVWPRGAEAALSCGLPEAQPTWIDFADGSVSFWRERFAQPIALNEMWGASLPTPLTATAERYRANVLRFVTRLAERGGRPALLVSSEPFTGGDAAPWWRSVAAVSDLVLENYANANVIWRDGPIDGSRRLRVRYRHSAAKLLAVGVPPARIGIMIGFQTDPGQGGREGLQPRRAWLEVVKLEALAAKEVANELKLGHVWSWGWQWWRKSEQDPAKPRAACVWLWARDPHLCNGPAAAGRGFNRSLTEGQIILPTGVHCRIGRDVITTDAIRGLQRVTREREEALTGVYARIITSHAVGVSSAAITAAEQAIVDFRFNRSREAYETALVQAHATPAVARAIIGDEIRRTRIEAHLRVRLSSDQTVRTFYEEYASSAARRVEVRPAPVWLGGNTSGLAIEKIAPPQLFTAPTGRWVRVRTAGGPFMLRALGPAKSLGSMQFKRAAPGIREALTVGARAEAFDHWVKRRQAKRLNRALCIADELPKPGTVDFAEYVPFLSADG
jgi:hypothetical protein